MMKSILTSIAGMLLLFTGHSQKMPAFKDVITEFYTHYSFESSDAFLRFEKRKSGWFVAEENYTSPGNHLNSTLFWSAKENKFLQIDYPLAPGDNISKREKIQEYLTQIDSNFEERQFKLHKYYGYAGWAWDIINDPFDESKMTASDWESRGRAYSNYASGYIAEQYGDVFENNEPDRKVLMPNSTINRSRIDKFISYENKAIEAFKKVADLNPNYQTTVGNIKIKCANEYLYAYCELLLAEDSVSAKKFVRNANYPDSLISLYKSYLEVLPPNSILIAGGDNDTYTFWYLQEVLNFRSDVTVLNISLLGFRRYLYVNRKSHDRQLFSTPDTMLIKNNFEYFAYSNKTANHAKVSVAQFISDLNKNSNPYNSREVEFKGEPLKTYYSKKLFFTSSPKKSGSKTGTVVSRFVNLGDYMYMNDFILLDLINTNISSRRIFFSFQYDFLSEILEYKKPVFEIIPFKN